MTTEQTRTVLAFGAGVDSTAMLIMALRGELDRLDAVVFSDPGAEFPHTYANVEVAERICAEAGIPFHRVHKTDRHGERITITDMLEANGTVPVMPGGPHVCSLKFKGEVMQRWAEREFPDATRIEWLIGIEANETHRNSRFTPPRGALHQFSYPLVDRGLTREDCQRIIRNSSWPIEVAKSSCVFCPFMSKAEVADLFHNHPEAWALADQVERRFQETSAAKHQAWIDGGRKLVGEKRPRAPRGQWRRDSWADGSRLFARFGLSTVEIAAQLAAFVPLTINGA